MKNRNRISCVKLGLQGLFMPLFKKREMAFYVFKIGQKKRASTIRQNLIIHALLLLRELRKSKLGVSLFK